MRQQDREEAIPMWITKKRFGEIEKRIAALEKEQLRIREYVVSDKKLHEEMETKIDSIPEKIIAVLNKNS